MPFEFSYDHDTTLSPQVQKDTLYWKKFLLARGVGDFRAGEIALRWAEKGKKKL